MSDDAREPPYCLDCMSEAYIAGLAYPERSQYEHYEAMRRTCSHEDAPRDREDAMKALTIREPWATLIQIGAKRVETRGWSTDYRGPLAIHAGKAYPAWARELCKTEPFATHLAGRGLNMGHVVALCRLDRVVRFTDATPLPPEPERSFGDYRPGRYAWVLADVRPVVLGPEVRGRQGLWTLGADAVRQAEARVADPEMIRMYPPKPQGELFPSERRQRSAVEGGR